MVIWKALLPTSLPLAGSGMGVILCHLAGVPSGSVVEVEAVASTAAGDFSEEGVTPAMGTWGDASAVNDLTASAMDVLEEIERHTSGEEVAIAITSNILAAQVSSSATSNCCIASACNKSARLHI